MGKSDHQYKERDHQPSSPLLNPPRSLMQLVHGLPTRLCYCLRARYGWTFPEAALFCCVLNLFQSVVLASISVKKFIKMLGNWKISPDHVHCVAEDAVPLKKKKKSSTGS